MTPFPLLGGIPIYASEFIGDLYQPLPPGRVRRRGPYRARRARRWMRAHPPYCRANGAYLMCGGRFILCHPEDLVKLRSALASQGLL